MEPQVRYCHTSDGVNIAYWTAGAGPPLVYFPPIAQHVQLDWSYPPIRDFYRWLSRRHQVARFDTRGRGLSQSGPIDVTFETELLDLEAVVPHLSSGPLVLYGNGSGAGPAVRYAARHPERVKQVILVDAVPPFPELRTQPWARALTAVLPIDYLIYTELYAYMLWGWQGGESTRQFAALARASRTQEQALREAGRTSTPEAAEDFAASLSRVKAPTLIVNHTELISNTIEAVRRLAAEIPDARLVLLEGDAVGSVLGDPLMMAAVDEFLAGEGDGTRAQLPAGMAVILFLDIVGSTALTERIGDTAYRATSRALDSDAREAIRAAGGSVVEGKVMGDGVMAAFTSAAQAIHAGRACLELSAKSELGVHIGIHAGDVIREEGNVYGGAVNIASRICDASSPGEILVSATVRDLARTSAGVAFEDRGERTFKGIEDPVRVFAVRPESG